MFPRRYLPSIPALLAIEALDRLGTASAAAAELNLTQGAISRQIQTLEDQLGTPLVSREKHRLALTPAARDFVAEARRALAGLAQASLTLRANPSGGTLRHRGFGKRRKIAIHRRLCIQCGGCSEQSNETTH